MEIDIEKIKKTTLGLDIRIAKNNLRTLYPNLNPKIEYIISDSEKFSVTGFKFNKVTGIFTFVVASDCLIDMLPMLYHENEFLKRFLMIFQSFFNQTDYLLSNIDLYFRPSETPSGFLSTLISWFGINLRLLRSNEMLIRRVLQYAVPLYKIRGTNKGLKLFLYLISGVMPEIIESNSSFKNLSIAKEVDIDMAMFSEVDTTNVFYVYFSCLESDLSPEIVETIHNIVQSEKPSYTQGFIIFKKPTAKKRDVTTYEDVEFDSSATEMANEDVKSDSKKGKKKSAVKKSLKEEKGEQKPTNETGTKKPNYDDSIIDF